MDDIHNESIEVRRQIAIQAEVNKNNHDSKYQSKPQNMMLGMKYVSNNLKQSLDKRKNFEKIYGLHRVK